MTQMRDTERLLRERILDLQEQLESSKRALREVMEVSAPGIRAYNIARDALNPASVLPGNAPYVPAEHRYPEGDEPSPASVLPGKERSNEGLRRGDWGPKLQKLMQETSNQESKP